MNKLQKTFDDIIERTRAKSIGTAGSFSGLCPAHDDSTPSLSVTLVDDKILLKCHTNCALDAICNALNIKSTELFSRRTEKQINRVPVQLKLVKRSKQNEGKYKC